MSEKGQTLALTQNVSRGFLSGATLPTQEAIIQSQQVEVSPQGVMTREEAYNGPGLNPVEGHKFCPGTQTRSRGELSCLPLGVTKSQALTLSTSYEEELMF